MVASSQGLGCYKIAGNVIDGSLEKENSNGKCDIEKIASEVMDSIDTIRDGYFSNGIPEISFDDLRIRQAYMYWAAPANALAFNCAIGADECLRDWIVERAKGKGSLSACCLGGGPGSEVLGLARWIDRNYSGSVILDALVTDKYVGWEETWCQLMEQINLSLNANYSNHDPALRLEVRGRFAEVDVQQIDHLERIGFVEEYDLFMISYVLSHIFSLYGLNQFSLFMSSVIERASPGTKFIFVDRAANSDKWKAPIRRLARASGLRLSNFSQIPVHNVTETEREEDLGKLFPKMPNLTRPSNAFWVTGTKV